MNYKKTYVPAKGYTPICKIGECSLKKLEFGIIELDAGEKLPFDTEDREVAFIMLEGHCNVSFDGERYENVGNRANVFENRKAESFYMPREQHLEIEAIDHIKIAVCGASRHTREGKDRPAGASGRPCGAEAAGPRSLPERDQLHHRRQFQRKSSDHRRGLLHRGQLGWLPAAQARRGQYARRVHRRGNLLLPV